MIAVAAMLAIAYARGVRSLARRAHPWPARRSAAAAGAVVAMGASSFVPVGTLTGHMAEHILLGMVAPLLFALSAPLMLALQTAPRSWRQVLRTGLRSKTVTWLTHPVVGFAVFGLTLIVLYLTPVLELSAHHLAIHVAVHLHLIAAGALFIWPLVGVDPVPRRLPFGGRVLIVMAAIPFHAFLGVVILSTTRPLAPTAYPSIGDQHRAGGLLWVSGELMTFVLASIIVRSWFDAERRADARADASEARSHAADAADSIS